MELLKRLILEDNGVTVIEYAFLAALIAMALIGGATLVGIAVNGSLTDVAGKFPAP